MTTITGKLIDAAGAAVVYQRVTATLVAATDVLAAAGGQVVQDVTTESDEGGVWSLDLTPLSALVEPGGAHYQVTAGRHRWTIDAPDSGTYDIGTQLVVPGPLPATGATRASLSLRWRVALWDGDSYVDPGTGDVFVRQPGEIVAFLGGSVDPTSIDGDLWIAAS